MPQIDSSVDDGSSTPATPRKQHDKNMKPDISPDGADASPTAKRRATPKKNEPTLLTDFFMGRQTPGRVAAERKRRQSLEAAKAAEVQQETKHDMKQSAVRRLQQPGGVQSRVRAWQRTHADNADAGNPAYAATEPSDVAFAGEDLESVTEEDRVRIKMRQKHRPTVKRYRMQDIDESKSSAVSEATNDDDQSIAPKKRVVSDENWMRQKGRKMYQRKVSPAYSKSSASDHKLPKNFTAQASNPPVSSKIKQWASKIEAPEDEVPRSYQPSKSRARQVSYKAKRDARELAARREREELKARAKSEKAQTSDDGIRVTGSNPSSVVRDDGIRVRPTETGSDISFPGQTYRPPKERRKASGSLVSDAASKSEVSDKTARNSGKPIRDNGYNNDSVPDTPTKKRSPRLNRNRTKSVSSLVSRFEDQSTQLSDSTSMLSSSLRPSSDLASNLTAKTLADIPGDIPFGNSAFSELDTAGKSRPKTRTKPDRNSSLKSMPYVFKKVMEEGKKILQDMNEAPRQQTPNNPPSIEKWLTGTMDPFIDTPAPKVKPSPNKDEAKATTKEESKEEDDDRTPKPLKLRQRRTSASTTPSKESKSTEDKNTSKNTFKENDPPSESTASPTSSKKADEQTDKAASPVTSIKRSKATRASPSPLRPNGGRREFLGMLKNAFHGESVGFAGPPKHYQSQENRRWDGDDETEQSAISDTYTRSSYWTDSNLTGESGSSLSHSDVDNAHMAGPRFKPPTNGHHQLSTIMSEEDSSSGVESDFASDLSHSTVTQSTTLTNESDAPAGKVEGPGLQRRLTKHSDLVSVLSLPDNNDIPQGIKNNRSRPSLRKNKGTAPVATAEELVKEFTDDEHLYTRELKTLVDGVVPVLLTHVVNSKEAGSSSLFGSGASNEMSKAVVGMGVALEKLKNAHKKAPGSDLRRLTHWAHGVVPIYGSYIRAWRLGFQDVVVNLAPAAQGVEEDDSLLDALPRNDSGDIVGADGERVAVAHLLKRPLVRIKQMVKLIRCADDILRTADTKDLLRDFEDLQDKARRRNRDEIARITDEDAANTDTTQSRDLKTLQPMTTTTVDPTLQVAAKDVFSLDLSHSNGQRMECRVELIHRDSQQRPNEQGDLLIREIGEGKATYLLFPPFTVTDLSARTGDGNNDMVVMIRGTHHGKQWHELITLHADDEDQILDWLDILPVAPVPPREPEPSVMGDDDLPTRDVPVGGRVMGSDRPLSPLVERPRSSGSPKKQPSSQPTSPRRNPVSGDKDKTPTKKTYNQDPMYDDVSHPLNESMRPEPLTIRKKKSSESSYREDGAPPPPAHRSLPSTPSKKKITSTDLPPPSDNNSNDKLKRRGSSPLKHEYLPSDNSSASGFSSIEESDGDSSDDELESLDIPETEVGVSIAKEEHRGRSDHLMADSVCSLTPSHSASQGGLYEQRVAQDEPVSRFMASISRWSDKGAWKDITNQPCSIIITAGLVEAYAFKSSETRNVHVDDRPLIALDLTPLVLIRQSTALDLEIRSTVQPHSRLHEKFQGGNFRFRCHNAPECFSLYMAVHHARLNNQKFIQLENEARFKSFGEQKPSADGDGKDGRRRSWFGRKNSYRGSRRPVSHHDGVSTTPSSNPSATSFLQRLTVAGNGSFNLDRSTVDRHSQPGSGRNSLYASESSSSGHSPRSPSVSIQNGRPVTSMDMENIRIRLHLLVSSTKWEDYGNCILQIRRPPPGWRQALRADHGMEKRITVLTIPKKETDPPNILLDAVLGSGCFSPMGSRGIVCGVWEELKGANGVAGAAPATGATGGNIKKWCFQCSSLAEASFVMRLVHQEVLTA